MQDSTLSPPKLMSGWANVVKLHPPGSSPRAGTLSPQSSPKARNGSVSGGSPRVGGSPAAEKDQQGSVAGGGDRLGEWGRAPAPGTSWGQRTAPSTPARALASGTSGVPRSPKAAQQAAAPATAPMAAKEASTPDTAAADTASRQEEEPQANGAVSPTAAAASEQASLPRKPVTPEKPAWGRVRPSALYLSLPEVDQNSQSRIWVTCWSDIIFRRLNLGTFVAPGIPASCI